MRKDSTIDLNSHSSCRALITQHHWVDVRVKTGMLDKKGTEETFLKAQMNNLVVLQIFGKFNSFSFQTPFNSLLW